MSRYFVFLFLVFYGCAAVPRRESSEYEVISAHEVFQPPEPPSRGVYHKVQKGETLYRIARAYDVQIQDIVRANNLANPSMIKEGQLLYIPGVEKTISLSEKKFIWPVNGKVIVNYHQKTKRGISKGIDILSSGDYNVRAVKSGVVSYSGEDLKGYGNVIIIDHGDEIYSVYAYADKVFVSKGEFVNQGETIAALSPQHPVLHFEIRKGHKPVDPLYYLGGIND
ncbi:MAG: hypothetical protein B6D53_00820 [Candidatus Omnitrophica bacterium 4484_49]|nr:MAG: hypothetical protein B6D53_00820 [Candidatus Omnitrophica bacterium 4484_49]